MSPRPSPLFIAALDARVALERVDEKLRNVRRRDLTKSERYALALVCDAADEVHDRQQAYEERRLMTGAHP